MDNRTLCRTKRIAVVSKRKNISDFFRLEAESVGCFVRALTELPLDMSEYDLVLLDGDISTDIALLEFTDIYRISTEEQTDLDKKILSYPVSLRVLRKLYSGSVSIAEGTEDDRGQIIIQGKNTVIYNNKKVILTESELRVLRRLGEAGLEPVSRNELKLLLCAEAGNITDVYICRLRKKLEEPSGIKLIKTVRGRGYSLLAKIKTIN